jgi:predicted acetyltransferase
MLVAVSHTRGVDFLMTTEISEQNATLSPVDVVPALQSQQSVLANLLELYIHDFSEFVDLRIGADGRFGYGSLPGYFSESTRHPFFIRVDNHLAGFAMVQRGSQITDKANIWDIAEFFVLRRYRRNRVGLRAAHQIWRMFTGDWEVRVMENHTAALEFWGQTVHAYAGIAVEPALLEVAGKRCHVFKFCSVVQANQPRH